MWPQVMRQARQQQQTKEISCFRKNEASAYLDVSAAITWDI